MSLQARGTVYADAADIDKWACGALFRIILEMVPESEPQPELSSSPKKRSAD